MPEHHDGVDARDQDRVGYQEGCGTRKIAEIDVTAAEAFLDSLKPDKDVWPSGALKETYLGACAVLEALRLDWAQMDSGQHVIFPYPPARDRMA